LEFQMTGSLILQKPAGSARQLLLLFHGVGGTARDMAPLGAVLMQAFPNAFIVSIDAVDASDLGAGRQWFSVRGITEENRPGRIDVAMPAYVDVISRWQAVAGVSAEATALVGFSQGAIMALESTRAGAVGAGRIVAIAGRFATSPHRVSPQVTLHLVHGRVDGVIPVGHAERAARELLAERADVTLDVLPSVGHEITAGVAQRVVERLREHVPLRHWDAALELDPGPTG
jgi:phospholipase/carboxylesterase